MPALLMLKVYRDMCARCMVHLHANTVPFFEGSRGCHGQGYPYRSLTLKAYVPFVCMCGCIHACAQHACDKTNLLTERVRKETLLPVALDDEQHVGPAVGHLIARSHFCLPRRDFLSQHDNAILGKLQPCMYFTDIQDKNEIP